MIPLNQLIPECLLALGGAFLLGNLAAYIRLRPAWREAKRARGGRAAGQGPRDVANGAAGDPARRTSRTGPRPSTAQRGSGATRAGTARTVGADSGASRTRVTKTVDPKPSGSRPAGGKLPARKGMSTPGAKLPSRARVLANVVIGLVITLAALATLIRG